MYEFKTLITFFGEFDFYDFKIDIGKYIFNRLLNFPLLNTKIDR